MSRVRTIAQALACALAATVVSFAGAASDSAVARLKAGREAMIAENPRAALAHYRGALALLAPEDKDERFAALLGVARSAAWLEDYKLAESSYRSALPLAANAEDRALAAAGLAQTLTIFDRPRGAFAVSSPLAQESLSNAVETARAALALGWVDKAAAALDPHTSRLTPEVADTRLGRDFKHQKDEIAFRTRPTVYGVQEYSKDSDGVRNYDTGIGTAFSAGAAPASGTAPRWEVAVHHQWIEDNSARAEISQVQGGVRFNAGDDVKIALNPGVARSGDWNYSFGGAQLSYRASDNWSLEISAERDAVKTIEALDNRITVRSGTIGGDVRLGNTVLAAALLRQSFSDGNDRDGAVLRMTLPAFILGAGGPSLALQLYGRYFENSRADTSGYFNPPRFDEQRINFILGARLSPQWVLRGTLGPGRQSVDGEKSSTVTGDLKLIGRIGQTARLEIGASYGDTAAFASSGAGYRRSRLSASLVVPW